MRGTIVKRMNTPRDGSKPQPRYYVKLGARWLSDPATGSGFRRKTDAEDYLIEVTAAMRSGTFVEPSNVTVAEYAARWLALTRPSLKPSTAVSYATKLNVHVVPTLGDVRLQDLTGHHLDGLYQQLLASGKRVKGHDPAPLSARSVAYVHTVVKAMLADAVRKGLLVRNPAEAATPPSPKRAADDAHAAMQTWTAVQVGAFLRATETHRYGPVWAFLALTGCRRGEALGLRWCDVDLDAGQATLVQSVGKVGGQTIIGSTKSGRGRTVALDAGLVAALKTHHANQHRERLMIGPGYTDNGLVFASPDGSPIYPETVSRAFKEQAAKAGLPAIRLHDLRHTWATLALAAGVPVKVVQERLGHATPAITLSIYSHTMPGMHAEAAELVAGLIGGFDADNVRKIGTR